jgi:phosphatidylglycerophosphate synthase
MKSPDSPLAGPAHTPALVLCDPEVGALRMAALTLLDRLVVALHRGGCAPIRIVCTGKAPPTRRADALGIRTEAVKTKPMLAGPTVVAECRMLVQAQDVRAVIAGQGRLVDPGGTPLPLGLLAGGTVDLKAAMDSLPVIRATNEAGLVDDVCSARTMERKLWDSLGSSSDGVVDIWFNRPLGRFLSKALLHTPVSPNQVTVLSGLIGLVSAWFFAQGTHWAGIAGALLLQLSALVDCVDGDLARIGFKESPIGKWLDIGVDQVVHVAVFAAIAMGLWRQGTDAPVLWLGASAVAGALISFPVVVRGRLLANKETDSRLEKFIDAASTRDFTALLMVLAVIDRLQWFLWLTGITVHVFWVTALLLQWPKSSKARPGVRIDA